MRAFRPRSHALDLHRDVANRIGMPRRLGLTGWSQTHWQGGDRKWEALDADGVAPEVR
jgi:hypothetical protein